MAQVTSKPPWTAEEKMAEGRLTEVVPFIFYSISAFKTSQYSPPHIVPDIPKIEKNNIDHRVSRVSE